MLLRAFRIHIDPARLQPPWMTGSRRSHRKSLLPCRQWIPLADDCLAQLSDGVGTEDRRQNQKYRAAMGDGIGFSDPADRLLLSLSLTVS